MRWVEDGDCFFSGVLAVNKFEEGRRFEEEEGVVDVKYVLY